jgi:hypothetical protein
MAKARNNKKSSGPKKGASWKLERASVKQRGRERPRSNKYSAQDRKRKPAPGSRQRVWVAGYTRADGTRVKGHYRELA